MLLVVFTDRNGNQHLQLNRGIFFVFELGALSSAWFGRAGLGVGS